MNRSNFLKTLATIVVAPSVLVVSKTVEVKAEKEWYAMALKCSEELYQDNPKALEHFLFKEMRRKRFNPSKKYILYTGWENDDFTRNLVTIIIKQETKYLLPSN